MVLHGFGHCLPVDTQKNMKPTAVELAAAFIQAVRKDYVPHKYQEVEVWKLYFLERGKVFLSIPGWPQASDPPFSAF